MNNEERNSIVELPIDIIDQFPKHPYKVKDDDDMIQLIESIKENGVITPIIVRPIPKGRYEMISGHRRLQACIHLGHKTIRGQVLELDRNAATVMMVDSNLARSNILPSEKAFATCIMILKKNKADNKTLFIDAANECIKVTNNNKLTQENMDRIVETYAERKEDEHFSHLAIYDEIQENDYNLSVSTYVEAEDTREKIDIVELNAQIAEIVKKEDELRKAIDEIIAEIEG